MLEPLFACDVLPGGVVRALPDPDPGATPEPGALFRWLHLDLTSPALPDWADAHLPPVAAAALLQAETRPRCDVHGTGLILNLRAINMNPGDEIEDMVSLRIWATDQLVVTVRKRRVFALETLRTEAAAGDAPADPGDFLERLTEKLMDRLEEVSVRLEDDTDALEEAIFDQSAAEADRLAATRRTVIRLRRYVWPQREALMRLAAVDLPFVARGDQQLLAETANRATRSVEELDAISARLAALQEHLYAEHTARIGRNGYVLSVVAAIFLPLTLLTGLFGVNVAGMPGLTWTPAFAVLSGVTALIGVVLYLVFRWLRWF